MDMAKKPHKKLTLTEKYERRRLWAGYFGIELKVMKRATKKALREAEKIVRMKRMELKLEGVTDIPSVSQVAKYQKELNKQQPKIDEREPLPYSETEEVPYYNEYEDVINEFLSAMGRAMDDAIRIYGLSQPYVARNLQDSMTEMLRVFNEARTLKGDTYVADYISNSLDLQRVNDMVYSDSDGRAEAVDEVETIIMGMMDGM